MTLFVLYAEIMPYNIIVFKALLKRYPNTQIHVVSWGEDKKLTKYIAPPLEKVFYYKKKDLNYNKLKALYDAIQPDVLYVSGRMEKDYLKLCLTARRQNKVVIGTSDNQYTGSLKQILSSMFGRFLYRRYFDVMMVPGLPQYEFARKLGFLKSEIFFSQYCADVDLFNKVYQPELYPIGNNILFLGRLNNIKGIDLLLTAHKKLYISRKITDKLIVIGSGPEQETLDFTYGGLNYYPFMSQEDIINILPSIKYFCLPSRKEPWGVVIHEAVAAGLPVLTTVNCGAASAFVKDEYNGLLIPENSESDLTKAIQEMSNKTLDEIKIMKQRSSELSRQITPDLWAETIYSIFKKRKSGG